MSPLRVVLMTAPSEEVAAKLARTLVEERLVACVNLVPGARSIYRFEGKVHDEREVVLLAKTVAHRVQGLQQRVKELHPYDVPEVVVLSAEGALPAYLAWVVDETARTGAG